MAVDMFVHVNVCMPFRPPASWTEGKNKGNVLHKNDYVIRRTWMFCPKWIVAFLGTSLPHANGIEMCPKRNLLDLSGLSKFLDNPQSITSCHIVDSRTCGAKWRRCGAFHTFGISGVKRITSTIHVVAELPVILICHPLALPMLQMNVVHSDQILQDSFGLWIGPTPPPTLSTSFDRGREGWMLYAVVVLKARNVPLNKQPKQSYQKTRLPKNDKRKGRMLGKLNASQSCFCSDCNSSSRVLTCGVGNYSRNVWCLRVAVGKNKICSKTKNHWPDQMVSSLHDYWKLL